MSLPLPSSSSSSSSSPGGRRTGSTSSYLKNKKNMISSLLRSSSPQKKQQQQQQQQHHHHQPTIKEEGDDDDDNNYEQQRLYELMNHFSIRYSSSDDDDDDDKNNNNDDSRHMDNDKDEEEDDYNLFLARASSSSIPKMPNRRRTSALIRTYRRPSMMTTSNPSTPDSYSKERNHDIYNTTSSSLLLPTPPPMKTITTKTTTTTTTTKVNDDDTTTIQKDADVVIVDGDQNIFKSFHDSLKQKSHHHEGGSNSDSSGLKQYEYLFVHAGGGSSNQSSHHHHVYQLTLYHVLYLNDISTFHLLLHDLGIEYILHQLFFLFSSSFSNNSNTQQIPLLPSQRSIVWMAAYFGATQVLDHFLTISYQHFLTSLYQQQQQQQKYYYDQQNNIQPQTTTDQPSPQSESIKTSQTQAPLPQSVQNNNIRNDEDNIENDVSKISNDKTQHQKQKDLEGIAQRMVLEMIEYPSMDGTTPLVVAATKNYSDIIRIFIKHGLDVTTINNSSALAAIGASYNYIDLFQILLTAASSGTSISNELSSSSSSWKQLLTHKSVEDGMTPLLYACQNGHVDIIRYFYTHKEKLGTHFFTQTDQQGYSATAIAIVHNQPKVIEYLNSIHHCPPTYYNRQHQQQQEEVEVELDHDDESVVTVVDINQPILTKDNETPLHVAMRINCSAVGGSGGGKFKKEAALEAYLKCNNCQYTARNLYGQTALHIAVIENAVTATQLLLRHVSRDILEKMDTEDALTGATPLYLASYYGFTDTVKLLIPISNDLEHICSFVNISSLPSNNHNNIDISTTNAPALIIATLQNHTGVVSALLEAGANVNIRDEAGHPALGIAARFGYYQLCHLLLQHPHIDVTLQSYKGGGTPLQKARKYRHMNVIELLESHGE